MHLLATTTGVIDGAAEPVDLNQTPADVVFLTAADSEIAVMAAAFDQLGVSAPTLKLANLLHLQHPFAVDLYISKTLSKAKLIILRLLGGRAYWPYGLESILEAAKQRGIKLAVLPGDGKPDSDLMAASNLDSVVCERLRHYCINGGVENYAHLLAYAAHLLGHGDIPPAAQPLSPASVYAEKRGEGPHIGLLFYRSVLEGGQTQPIDAVVAALTARNFRVSALAIASLKDEQSTAFLTQHFDQHPPDVLINFTSFAASAGGLNDPLSPYDCPVLQGVLSSSSHAVWQASSQGLSARDLAMSVVLPELDGRIHAGVVSFKSDSHWHDNTQCRITTQSPVKENVDALVDLAANWAALRRVPPGDKRLAIILANYPVRDGRIANGVGYDTPASTIAMLHHLKAMGYGVDHIPGDGDSLIANLAAARKEMGVSWPVADYLTEFAKLPEIVRTQINERWGEASCDPTVQDNCFNLSITRHGAVIIAIQPSRGYDLDPQSSYHDPSLIPPHGYLALYLWVAHHFKAHALIHNGKHGTAEWLPGKAVALSESCFPRLVTGALPHLYPFIVNDPGEGTQAKRRTHAVIIDHLTPPLTRAESYGPLRDLEALIDEYYIASGLDSRRALRLRADILALTRSHRLDEDAGLNGVEEDDLVKLDAYLCDLKEAQIRDGLHIFGQSPSGVQERDLLIALTRCDRGQGQGGDKSLIKALAEDLSLTGFDPLSLTPSDPWEGPKPQALVQVSTDLWRNTGDTLERLELLAQTFEPQGPVSAAVLQQIEADIRPRLQACGPTELAALITGLQGKHIAPGPSGAPTRGRLDVLPTGRNFYSLDNRTLPTPSAWELGQRSAEALLNRHLQDFGAYPKSIGLTAWGTSNMRTGGDDIAQALALIGAKPVWDRASWRVTGFEILPPAALGRPRVDVTLRISGLFRDAFPAQIELLDRAMRAAGALEEDAEDNPIAARMRQETEMLMASGLSSAEAKEMAGHRIFGAKPGAYGAGLQAMIDEKLWTTRADLAAVYVTWGAYAYGTRAQGVHDEALFRRRLKSIEAVVQNQDNREHDLLDSDDYYQFEGGMSAAVEQASGMKPRVYHNDHSRPERPVIRTLEEEVGRVVRSRTVNPKWIAGVKRHGYKGAFEIAATVDYMFAFAATTSAVKTHHFDLAFDAYLVDEETRQFLADHNPAALRDIAQRFSEAAARGLWSPRLNSAHTLLEELQR